jgi:hypothetical protein
MLVAGSGFKVSTIHIILFKTIRVFCWHITIKSENQYNLHRLHRSQSRKILQNTPYKSTSNTFLINSRLFAIDNRFSVQPEAAVLIIQIIKRMERKDSNHTEQTNSTEKKQVPDDWLPVSGGKTKSPKLTSKEMDAEFQKMLEEGVIDGISPNRNDTEEPEHSIGDSDTVQPEDRNNATDSLQTDLPKQTESTSSAVPAMPMTSKRSSKQRKESLEEYRGAFLQVPTLEDRKPVFISREVRDRLDEIVRRLGGRRMSLSGFIENLARHHLEMYRDDVEGWKKL